MRTIFYKRATFVTHLPADYLYTQSHSWLSRVGENEWRVGYTKFALRMLGELVDIKFEVKPAVPVKVGDILGNIEGFKAISDIYCVGEGNFGAENSGLAAGLEYVGEKPYDDGWLYQFAGKPDPRAMDVEGYRALLDATIDRLLEKQRQDEEIK
jgi:glycine cleavage system H protein